GGGEGRAVGREGQAEDGALVALEPANLLARGGVPQPDEVVPVRGGQRLAVGRKGQVIDGLALPSEVAELLAGAQVPQPQHANVFPRGQGLAVGREGQGGDGGLARPPAPITPPPGEVLAACPLPAADGGSPRRSGPD